MNNQQTQQLEQEMYWLFGEDWRDMATPAEYTFALSRLQQRRQGRGCFFLGTIIGTLLLCWWFPFILGVPYLLGVLFFPLGAILAVALVLIPLGLYFAYALSQFPSTYALSKREREAGRQFLVQTYGTVKRKRRLTLGDDGELVEVEADHAQAAAAKTKRG